MDGSLVSTLKAVIISKKGGVHLSDINEEYKELTGLNIPCSHGELKQFLTNIPGITVDCEGMVRATSANTKHLELLISKQKTKVVRGARLVGAIQSKKSGRPASHYPRYKSYPRQESSRENYYVQAPNSTYCSLNRYDHINGWVIIGDDLMRPVLGQSRQDGQDSLCRARLTISEACREIWQRGCFQKVIVVLGSVDVLVGRTVNDMQMDMCDLLYAIRSCGADVVVCTLPPMPNICHSRDRVAALRGLNSYILQGPWKVSDLNCLFFNRDFSINYSLYGRELVYVWGCSVPHILWNEDGCDIVRHHLNRWQIIQYY